MNVFTICRVQLYFVQKYKKTDKTPRISTDYTSYTHQISGEFRNFVAIIST